MRLVIVICALCVLSFTAFAKEKGVVTGMPLPRFVSIRSDEVNVRSGPGTRFPVKWVLQRKGLPVEIIQEYDIWRKIRDIDGEEGWVQQSMVSANRTAIIQAQGVVKIYASPSNEAKLRARLEPGVQVTLITCADAWCQVEIQDIEGYIEQSLLWGIYESERFD